MNFMNLHKHRLARPILAATPRTETARRIFTDVGSSLHGLSIGAAIRDNITGDRVADRRGVRVPWRQAGGNLVMAPQIQGEIKRPRKNTGQDKKRFCRPQQQEGQTFVSVM